MNDYKNTPGCDGDLYTIEPGDTLFKIAKRNNISIQDLLDANPQIKKPEQINVGQVICIPVISLVIDECALILDLSREATVAGLPEIAGGVVLIQRLGENNYAFTFAATGLPSPESIGEFNTYIGSININGQQYSAVLRGAAPFEQELTWCGTRVIPDNPFNFPQSAVSIVPFNLETNTRTNPILGGIVKDCLIFRDINIT